MSIEEEIKGNKGPYLQFEKCILPDVDCKYRNLAGGTCIYETCIYQNEFPLTVAAMRYKCMVCDEENYRDPREMKIQICDDCLARMKAAEKKPFSCVFCGGSQSHNSKIFLSKICDECFGKLNRSRTCKRCGN